jgi:uncharacterized membrane protein (UPF0127 family)
MRYFYIIPLLVLCCSTAQAQTQNTFIYAKTILKIIPKAEVQTLTPAAPADKNKETDKKSAEKGPIDPASMMPVLKRVPKEFTVELRQASFLTQKDFIAHQPFTDEEGMLILIDPPAQTALKPTHMISSADVLFVDEDGIIIKIAPELKLSELSESIDSNKPIHAFVYLKAGTASASDIRIGDHIENSYFKTHPVVIQ